MAAKSAGRSSLSPGLAPGRITKTLMCGVHPFREVSGPPTWVEETPSRVDLREADACGYLSSMLLALILVVLAAAIGLLRGGSLATLADTKFRWAPVLFAALIVQLGFDLWDPPWLSDAGGLAVLLASHVTVALFFALNWRLPGMSLAAAGFLLNVVVIAANGAMPVSQRAVELAGLENFDEFGIKHERLEEGTALPWLADVIPFPRTGVIISAGDVLLATGIGWLVYRRTTPEREGAEAASPTEASG